MPFDKKEYMREYRKNNKDKIKNYKKEYREKNKDKIKEYRIRNKEYFKEYRKSPTGLKSHRIRQWKHYGILFFDYDLLYDIYTETTTCDYCHCQLNTSPSSRKCVDHDHSITDYDNVRGILCNSCNIKDVLNNQVECMFK